MSSSEIDGPLYVEVNKVWEEVYVTITGTRLEAFKRIREDVPASKSNRSDVIVMQVWRIIDTKFFISLDVPILLCTV